MVDLYRGYNEGLLTEDPTRFSDIGVSGPDFLRGMKYTPFDLLGAPVDLLNMGLQGIDAMYGQRNALGSERPFLGSEDLINRYADLGGLMGVDYDRPTGSGSELLGRIAGGILAPTVGAQTVGRVVDAGADYIAGAPARVADRARSVTLGSGIDPAAALDDMIVRGMGDNGGASPADTPRGLLDQPQAAQGEPVGLLADDPVRQMDTAQARYFETGNFEPPTAENPVSIVPPTPDEPGIIAFHGSGADFDEFRLEMIGTGEGAQAYGYGLYFTDSEDIAKFYRDTLGAENLVLPSGNTVRTYSMGDMAVVEDALPSELERLGVINQAPDGTARYNKPSVLIAEAIGEAGSDDLVENTRKYLETKLETESSFERQKLGFTKAEGDALEQANINALAAFDKMVEAGIETKTGKMYKVGLAPKPDELLDYDLPLSQQPKAVQKQIENLVGDLLAGEPENYDRFDFKALAAIRGESPTEGYSPTGDDILTDLQQFFAATSQEYGRIRADGAMKASELLNDFGIQGIKYRAAGSRGAATADEAAERNYVIFDDKAVKILEKYGISGPVLVTGAGMAREEQPQPTRGIL